MNGLNPMDSRQMNVEGMGMMSQLPDELLRKLAQMLRDIGASAPSALGRLLGNRSGSDGLGGGGGLGGAGGGFGGSGGGGGKSLGHVIEPPG